ncbi:MAG: BspA family leucine-rich repeat surface protein, partial [Bacteroidales bacterium]|nr:BspA family leucine-rich repeat surface protein [Bacteroidales bacterium]
MKQTSPSKSCKSCTLISIFLLLLLASFASPRAFAANEKEAYAVITGKYIIGGGGGYTLTFYYDNQKASRAGHKYELNTWDKPGWCADLYNPGTNKVIFDPSFKDARPKSCYEWFSNMSITEIQGIEYLNTSEVVTMAEMFEFCDQLTNLDVSKFNTSSVTDMQRMFYDCKKLTSLDFSNFNTANVENMQGMFTLCHNLTSLNVSSFNTTKVTNMCEMFKSCTSLTSLDLNNFNTANVIDMGFMFMGCNNLTSLNLSGFNTDKVNLMDGMFEDCSSLKSLDVSHFITDNVMNMEGMFKNCSSVQFIDVSKFNTAKVYAMGEMFSGCCSLTSLDVSNFNTDNVSTNFSITIFGKVYLKMTGMANMFSGCSKLTTLDVSRFNTSGVNDMNGMFSGCSSLTSLDVSRFNTSGVKDMSGMFSGCSSLISLDVSGFNTAKVENMSEMFRGVQQVKMLDLSNFKTTRVTDMSYMFYGCGNLRAIYVSDQWNTDNVAMDKSVFMFFGCGKLKGYKGTKYHFSVTDKRYARLDEGGLKPGYLSRPPYAVLSPDNKTLTFYQDNDKDARTGEIFDIEYTADGHVSWYGKCGNVERVVFDDSFATHQPDKCDYWFSGFTKLKSFVNADNFNTSVLSSTKAMFENCTSLTTDGISELLQSASVTTAEVTNMAQMFSGCTSLSTIDMSLLDVSEATNMSGMFNGCTSLERLDMSCMNVANVTNMSNMFSGCSHLQSLYVSDTWDVSGVTQSEGMFSNCTSLVGGQGTRYTASHTDKEYAHIDGNPSAGYLTKPEAYACITKYNETTITFYYDGMQSLRGRTCHVYPLKTSGSPYWYTDNSYKIITTVVFDPSFKYAQPTSCECWFYMMDKLKEIQGIEYLNTSEVTTMDGMFNNCKELTSLDLSHFSTENVNSMYYMFFSCEKLKSLDLSSFNTAKVTNMESMFRGCSELTTINVSEGWSTDKVSYDNSSGMFYNCNKIVGCKGTTYKAGETGKEYARIDEGKNSFRPGYLSGPRQAYAFLSQDKKTLTFYYDAQKTARSAQGAVYELNTTNEPPEWLSYDESSNITKVVFDSSFADARPTNCYRWFDGFSFLAEIVDIANLNTSNVTTMEYMFRGCKSLTNIDVSNFNTANVTKMNSMFDACSSITKLNLSKFNTAKVTNMAGMFAYSDNLTTITVGDDWSTESVTKSSSMFSGCPALVGEYGTTYDADHTDATYAHLDRPNAAPGYLSYIYQPYVVITKNQNTFTLTFYYDDLIDTRVGNKYYLNKGNEDNPSWFDQASRINKVVFDPSIANAWISTCSGWFAGMGSLSTIEGLEYLNTSNVMSFRAMFAACESFSDLDLSCLNTEAATDMCEMFCLCSNLTNLNIRNFNTSKVEVMDGMFADCPNLTTITVGDEWSTASVIESTNMFKDCSALVGERGTTYDASHKDASYAHPDGGIDNPGYLTSINKAYAWLQGNSSLGFFFDDKRDTREGTTYDLNTPGNSPGWIDNSVAQKIRSVYFDNSFRRARPVTCEKWFCGLNLLDGIYNIENLNTSEVKDMSYMFKGYNRDLDLSTFNTAKVENMEGMFSEAHINRLDVSSFNTSQVKNMKDMFSGNDNFTYVNLNSFNTAAVEDMSGMFNGCSRLLSIIVGDEWDTQSVSASTNMFAGCTELVGEKGTLFSDTNPTDKDYAIVDGGSSNPGYLTLNEAKIIYDLAGGELPIGMSNPENFNFGTVITLNNPERAGYEFKGWTGKSRQYGPNKPNLQVTIYSDITYYNRLYIANWTPIKYTISFVTNGGSSISPINADYESSVAPPQDPVREGYIFDGWLPEFPSKMPLGGLTVTAQWKANKYTITFDSDGGSTVNDIEQDYESVITPPQNPVKEGYTFTGWSPELPEKMPLNGMTVTAQWTINKYKIIFNTDGATAIADIVAEYDAAITAPLDPKRKGYTFDGWDPTIPAKMPAENLTVKAQWKAIKYKITFDTDGAGAIDPIEQDYESDITAPQDPVKEGYTFTGWNPELPDKMPLDGLTVKAQWTINKYKITFDTDGGNTIPDLEQDYESDITAPQDPVKEGYTFTGWEPEIPATMPLDGLTVKAQWTINKYKITFDTDGAGAIDPIEADYQSAITAPKDPVKEGYTFTGWKPNIPATMPLDGLTVKAQWKKNQYTLKFMTDETTVYKQFALDFGAAIAAPADPEKYGFNFGGWQPEVPQTMPAADLTISAIWLAQGQYVIRFITQGGTVIDPIVGFAGDAITAPADPTREGYTFAGWDKPVPTVMPEANTEITAQWKANSYTVTYNAGNGEEPVTVSYDFGAAIATPANPERTGYTFDGWDAAIPATMPASNLTFSARWKINQYTMIFMTDETTVYEQIMLDFGTEITAPAAPAKDGFTFGGWDKPVPTTMPAENITLTAQWVQGEFSITFMTDETTVYKVVAQDYGTTVSAPADPIRSGYIFLGWDKAVPATMPAENIILTAQWQKAAITVAETEIVADTRNEYFCNGYAVATFTVTAGNPNKYTIEFAEGGIESSTGSLTGSTVEIPLPKGLSAGTYTGTLQLADAEGNASPRIPLTLTVSLPFYTIVPLYVDVAAVN